MKVFYSTIFIIVAILSINDISAQVSDWKFKLLLNAILSKDVPSISVGDASANSSDFIFADAREKEEYNVSHIKNARFVGAKHFSATALADLPKDKPIIVYCSVGKRSQDVTKKLIAQGFTNVRNLYGGIFEWVNESHPVYAPGGMETKKVHVYNKFWGGFLDRGSKVTP
jgi:rhodanese-related sulfurtransferase